MSKKLLEYGEKVTVTGYVTGQVADTTDNILKFNVEFCSDSTLVPYSLINQSDEPQKVVIPWFVADKIEYCKKEGGYGLFHTMDYCFGYQESAEWLEDNQETFARAWIEGYEAEQEKLYTVEIPNPNNPNKHTNVLSKNTEGKVFLDVYLEDDDLWKNEPICQLTEAEIKKDFEWARQWAEEVK